MGENYEGISFIFDAFLFPCYRIMDSKFTVFIFRSRNDCMADIDCARVCNV